MLVPKYAKVFLFLLWAAWESASAMREPGSFVMTKIDGKPAKLRICGEQLPITLDLACAAAGIKTNNRDFTKRSGDAGLYMYGSDVPYTPRGYYQKRSAAYPSLRELCCEQSCELDTLLEFCP